MFLFGRLGHCARSAWKLWRRGGDRAIVEHVVARLRGRLGVAQLEARVQSLEAVASTWAVTSWIEHAVLDQTPLVSVVLPTRNRSHLLLRAIDSVRAQAYPFWEVVIVDDGSTDDTPLVIERLAGELDRDRLRAIRIPPSGASAARNHGLASAKGSLIAYLDDDNLMHPLWLKAVAWAFAERPDVDVVYGGIIIDDILRFHRRPGGGLPSYHLPPFDRRTLADSNPADMGTIAHRSGLPEARFDEGLRQMGDWDLLIRLTRDKAPLVLPAVACFYSTTAPHRLTWGPTSEADAARVRKKAAG